MTAAQELLVDGFVAATAIAGRQLCGDDEPVMVLLLLVRRGLVAFEAVHALRGVLAHLVFVHHGVLCAGMALRAFARGSNQFGTVAVRFPLQDAPG